MEQLITSLGTPAIGFAFAYFILTHYFKQQDGFKETVEKLCKKIDEFMSVINSSQLSDVEFKGKLTTFLDNSRDDYLKIHSLIDAQNDTINRTYILCDKLYSDRNRTALGRILLNKGYITEEQLAETLEEQRNYKEI